MVSTHAVGGDKQRDMSEPETQPATPPPSPPFQFSLRTLLLLFVVLGSSLGVFGAWGVVVFVQGRGGQGGQGRLNPKGSQPLAGGKRSATPGFRSPVPFPNPEGSQRGAMPDRDRRRPRRRIGRIAATPPGSIWHLSHPNRGWRCAYPRLIAAIPPG